MQLPSIRRSFGLRLSLVIALVAVIGGLAIAPASAAPPPPDSKVAQANDTYVKSQCRFTTTSANYALGTVRGRLSAKVSWNGYTGFKNVAQVSVQCFLYSANTLSEVAEIEGSAVGRAAYVSDLVTVPVATGYFVCVQAQYQLHSGPFGNVSTVCA